MHNVRFLFPILISVPLGCVKFFFKRRITLPFIRKRNINLAACDLLENSFRWARRFYRFCGRYWKRYIRHPAKRIRIQMSRIKASAPQNADAAPSPGRSGRRRR